MWTSADVDPEPFLTEYRSQTDYYAINFTNDGSPISMQPQPQGNRLNVVSLNIPIFDNISEGLETNLFVYEPLVGPPVEVTLPDGFYEVGVGLALALTAAAPVLNWTYDIHSKRIAVTSAADFAIRDSRLVNLILGFEEGSIDGSTNTYVSTQLVNTFPYSHFIMNCDKITSNTYIADNHRTSMVLPVSADDLIVGKTYTFDKQSPYWDTLGLIHGNLFPLLIEMYILFNDNTISRIPDRPNQRYTITLAVRAD